MSDQPVQRRLAAVLAADVAGYTRLMEEDSEGTVAAWQVARDGVIEPAIGARSGRVVKLTGDGFLAEFPTVEDAVNCAIDLQAGLLSSSLDFRIGVNLGDIIDDGRDIHGEGVNVAARIEALAEPGGLWISGSVHQEVRNKLDVGFEDQGEQVVKNVSVPVRVYRVQMERRGDAAAPADDVAVAADKPALAVLPFDNLGGNPEEDYLADGMTEDIITALSKFHWFYVIARNSVFTYKGHAQNVQTVGKELGVRYVLEGSIRKAGNRVRITAQLIDAASGNHIWAERFDRQMDDVFELQDEASLKIAGSIAPEVSKAELAALIQRRTENLNSWELYVRGMANMATYGKLREETKRIFEQAIERPTRN